MSDLEKEVRAALTGAGSLGGGLASDTSPLDAVSRAYGQRGEPVSRAVAACLTDEDPSIRALAAMFFEQHSDAPGAEAVVKAWLTRPELFVGVENPWRNDASLAWQLLRAVGTRVLLRDREAIEVAKREALVPGNAPPLIAALTRAEPRWVARHAEEIVGRSPDAGASILIHMSGVDVGALGEKIAPVAARSDPDFRARVDRLMDDGPVKQRIFAALK